MKIKTAFLISAATLILQPLVAFAYVPPSFFMVKKLSEKRAGLRSVKVTTLVKELKDKNPSGIQFKQITLYDERTGVLRSWALNPAEKPVFYQERRLGVGPSGAVAPEPVADFLLFQSQVVPLARALVQAGVPVRTEIELNEMQDELERRAAEQTLVKRWSGTYSWVIGQDVTKPQLWLEKDGFLPMRYLSPSGDTDKDLEIQFNLHRVVSGGFFYPNEVLLLKKGNPVLREEVVSVSPNPSGTGGLSIRSSTGLIDDGEGMDSRLKDLLTLFYTHVR